MADYGVYKGPKKKAAAPASASSDLGSSSSYASTERPAPAVPSSRGYAPAQSQERFEPLVGSNAADTYNDESGCPNCGARAARPGAQFCDACGFSVNGKNMGAAGRLANSEWTFDPMRYGLFGWLETALGCVAWIVGFASLAAFRNPGLPLTPLRIAEGVMVCVILLILAVQLVQRWFYREIFAFIYGILAIGGMSCAALTVFNHSPSPGSFFMVIFFAWAVAMGCKCFWLACGGVNNGRFNLLEHPMLDTKLKLWIVTILHLVVALVGFLLQLLILTTTFEEL